MGQALPHVTQVGSPSGIWRAALPRARASRERITFSTGSLLKDSKKRRAVCTRPTPGLPAGPPAPSAQAGWPKPREAQGISQRKLQNSSRVAQAQTQAPASSVKVCKRQWLPREPGAHPTADLPCYHLTPGLSFPICK